MTTETQEPQLEPIPENFPKAGVRNWGVHGERGVPPSISVGDIGVYNGAMFILMALPYGHNQPTIYLNPSEPPTHPRISSYFRQIVVPDGVLVGASPSSN